MREQSISFDYSNVIIDQKKRLTESLSNRWSCIAIFVLISYLISEVFIFTIKGFAVNLQQCALLITIAFALTRYCKLGKACKWLMFSTGLYVAISGMSFFYCAEPKLGVVHYASLMINWFFLLALCSIGSSTYKTQNVEFFFKWVIIMGIFEMIIVVLQVSTGNLILSSRSSMGDLTLGGTTRAIGTFRDPTYLAFYLSVCFLRIYVKLITCKKRIMWDYILMLLFLIGIILSGSVTSLFSLGLGLLIITLIWGNVFQILGRLFSIILILTILAIVYISMFSGSKRFDYYSNKLHILSPSNFERNARYMHLVTGWNMMKAKPFGGHGYGTFQVLSENYIPRDYFITKVYINKWKKRGQHNLISHVFFATLIGELGSMGIIVFTFIIYIIFKGVTKVRKSLKNNFADTKELRELYLFFVGFLAAYFVRMLGYGFRLSDSFIIIFVVMGMLLVDGRITIARKIIKNQL